MSTQVLPSEAAAILDLLSWLMGPEEQVQTVVEGGVPCGDNPKDKVIPSINAMDNPNQGNNNPSNNQYPRMNRTVLNFPNNTSKIRSWGGKLVILYFT